MAGIKILSEMSDDELREEIIETTKEWLTKLSRDELLQTVVSNRVTEYRRRLMNEGSIEEPPGIMGFFR